MTQTLEKTQEALLATEGRLLIVTHDLRLSQTHSKKPSYGAWVASLQAQPMEGDGHAAFRSCRMPSFVGRIYSIERNTRWLTDEDTRLFR